MDDWSDYIHMGICSSFQVDRYVVCTNVWQALVRLHHGYVYIVAVMKSPLTQAFCYFFYLAPPQTWVSLKIFNLYPSTLKPQIWVGFLLITFFHTLMQLPRFLAKGKIHTLSITTQFFNICPDSYPQQIPNGELVRVKVQGALCT